ASCDSSFATSAFSVITGDLKISQTVLIARSPPRPQLLLPVQPPIQFQLSSPWACAFALAFLPAHQSRLRLQLFLHSPAEPELQLPASVRATARAPVPPLRK